MRSILPLALGLCILTAQANDIKVTTPDGAHVILHADRTWEYAGSREEADKSALMLTLDDGRSEPGACTFGMRLLNNADYKVGSIVPQISVYKAGDVLFDTVFIAFNSIKPTLDQYKEISVRGIACEEIAYLRVHGADRCNMDDLNKFSPVKGECLSRIQVVPSSILEFSKR